MTGLIERRRLFAGAAVLLALCVAAPAAQAQAFPSRSMRIVVNFPPGGAADQIGRVLAAQMQAALGQTVVVENRAGANGTIGAAEVVKAAPDGHTLLMSSGGAITVSPLLMKGLAFDPMKALDPVAPAAVISVFLETKPAIPVSTLPEFIAHLRANPGKLNYGSPGNGSSPHLAGEMFNRAAKVQTTHVPYKGAGPAMTDLLGGQLDFMFDPGIGLAHVRAGKLKMLAVGSPKRHPAFPDVPTVAEIIGGEFDADTVFGLYVPAGTSKDIVATLNREIGKAMASAEMKARLSAIAAQPLVLSPAEFAARVQAEHERMKVLVREANLQTN